MGHKITPVPVTGNYDMVIGETPSGVAGPPPHFHSKLHEMFLVIEGEMEFVVDGKHQTLKAGDSLDLPANAIHTFRNISESPCRWVNVHSPKGFLSFFVDMGVSNEEENAMNKSVDKSLIDTLISKAADYDMHIRI